MANISDIGDALVEDAILRAQEAAENEERSQNRISVDLNTEATEGLAESYYDADERTKAKGRLEIDFVFFLCIFCMKCSLRVSIHCTRCFF